MNRFNVIGTHVEDKENPEWFPQFINYKIAKMVADKLNEVNNG